MRIKLDITISREPPVRRLVALTPLLLPLVQFLTRRTEGARPESEVDRMFREAMRDPMASSGTVPLRPVPNPLWRCEDPNCSCKRKPSGA